MEEDVIKLTIDLILPYVSETTRDFLHKNKTSKIGFVSARCNELIILASNKLIWDWVLFTKIVEELDSRIILFQDKYYVASFLAYNNKKEFYLLRLERV